VATSVAVVMSNFKTKKKVAYLLLNDFLVYSFASDEACIQMV